MDIRLVQYIYRNSEAEMAMRYAKRTKPRTVESLGWRQVTAYLLNNIENAIH